MEAAPTLVPKSAETAFGRIEYLDRGAGRPVLVLHGSPGGHDQGSLMADFLVAAGCRAVIPSRPGYPGSALTEANRSIDGTADALAALMDGLGIGRFGVLCWSGGGPSAYRLARRHAGRVTALVALAAVSRRYTWRDAADERFMFGTAAGNWVLKILREHAPHALVSGTLASEGALSGTELKLLVEQVWADEAKRRFVLDLSQTISWREPRQSGLDNDKANFAAIDSLELHDITVPTLLVHGLVDTDVAPEHSRHAAAQIPGVQVIWVELGGHLAAFTAADSAAIQARITAFLRRGEASFARRADRPAGRLD
jgi:pimeloyl-ACP methyl ester carboxylesterase